MPGEEESDSGRASSQGPASIDQMEAMLARHHAQQKTENERAIAAGIAAGLLQAGITPGNAQASEPVARILARQRADDIKVDWRKLVKFRGQDPAGATAVQMRQLADIGAEAQRRREEVVELLEKIPDPKAKNGKTLPEQLEAFKLARTALTSKARSLLFRVEFDLRVHIRKAVLAAR